MWRRLVLLALGSLSLGTGVRYWRTHRLPQPLPAPHQPALGTVSAQSGKPRWKPLWSVSANHATKIRLAPDGNVACLFSDSTVCLLRERDGLAAWKSQPLLLARELVAARGGVVLAYSPHNPSLPKVWVLRGKNVPISALPADGAVWSATTTLDGELALIGTGTGTVTQYALATQKPPQVWQIGARPEFLATSTDGTDALVGTWLPAGVRRLGGWTYLDSDPARWQEIQVSADGATAVALSGHGPRRSEKLLHLAIYAPDTGIRLWETDLFGRQPKVLLSADGQRIALSYLADTARGEELRLRILDRSGAPLCEEKGGRFLSPRLAAISAEGQRITVLDGDRALFVLDSQGNTRWRLAFENPAPIVETFSSPDGTYLLLVRADDTLTLYKATE